MRFAIGNSLNKFGLTVWEIFGGQGYFNIIGDPKHGITGMEIVLEFGAIFHLELFVASGSACLVAGIYIKKYDGNFDLRGYILCAGRLSVLGIFSASLSFYLGLHGNSQVIEGECTVTASCKIGPFFEISVDCTMHKEIHGTSSGSSNQPQLQSLQAVNGTENTPDIVDSNLTKDHFYTDDFIYVSVRYADNLIPGANLEGQTTKVNFGLDRTVKSGDQMVAYLKCDLSQVPVGSYQINVFHHDKTFTKNLFVNDENSESEDMAEPAEAYAQDLATTNLMKVSARDYYASYYHN